MVRILDLSQYMAGPYGTLILADLGAEVIKFENPEGGELSRTVRQFNHKGESAYYMSFNKNKKSVTMNFKSDKTREIFYELVKISDVVYDNFRSGILEKFKLDYENLKKVNPKDYLLFRHRVWIRQSLQGSSCLGPLDSGIRGGHELHGGAWPAASGARLSYGRSWRRDVRRNGCSCSALLPSIDW